MKLSITLLVLGLVGLSRQDERGPKVKTPLGCIRGSWKTSQSGRKYAAYEGIPYAAPPVGQLRFQPPQPVQKWDQELPATKKSSVCMQYLMGPDSDGDRVTGCEDCLYLNIYVPVTNSSKPLPVMYWIHGGAFQFSSGNDADEKIIMERDIIFITVNYRLGPFGFLSTGNEVVPGNMGLKDQSLGLQWVSTYIKYFGGDSGSITLFGMSAGGASVHYHYMSQWSAGLFHRGISISGVALDSFAQTKRAPEKAKELGGLMGCPTGNSTKMIACLKERPARLISQAVGDFMPWLYNPFTPFGPVVEKGGAEKPFIDKSPIEIISKGQAADLPWISGVVSEEGLYTAAQFVNNDQLLKQLNDEWDDIAPFLLDYNDTITIQDQKSVSEKIRKHYLGSKQIDSSSVTPVIHMMGDRLFRVDYEKAVRLQAKANKSPVYCYYYTYRAQNSLSTLLGAGLKNFGVSHGDDIFLILDARISNTKRPEDVQMQQVLLDFYTSFAIFGEPHVGNAKWRILNPEKKRFEYLKISSPRNINMSCSGDFGEKKFWDSIHFNENKLCHCQL